MGERIIEVCGYEFYESICGDLSQEAREKVATAAIIGVELGPREREAFLKCLSEHLCMACGNDTKPCYCERDD